MPARDGVGGMAEAGPAGRRPRSCRPIGRIEPASAANSSSWPWPFERDDAGDLAIAEVEGDVVELGADAEVADAEARRRRRRPPRVARRVRSAGAGLARCAAPSISSTICSSTPGAMSTTPTVSPSRSTVARSQSAEISTKRCEMKMTERPGLALAAHHVEHALGEVGRQRGGHLVEQQHVGLDRQRARQVEHAQHGERNVARGRRAGRDRERRARAPSRGTARPACAVRRRLDGDVEIGDQRRLLVDRDQAGAARVGGRAHVAGLAADQDAPGIRPDRAGQDLDQRRLAGAVGAHQRMHLARQHRQRRVAQRRHGAVVLRDAGGVEERVLSVTMSTMISSGFTVE